MRGAGAACVPNGDGTFNKSSRTRAAAQRPLAQGLARLTASEHLLLRASYGRGVRFPNVEELYNGTVDRDVGDAQRS